MSKFVVIEFDPDQVPEELIRERVTDAVRSVVEDVVELDKVADEVSPEAVDEAIENLGDEGVEDLMSKLFGPQLAFEDLPEVEGLSLSDISDELYRTYEVCGGGSYTIESPVGLYLREGGTTHRVVDADGEVHCVPFPNEGRTAIRWRNQDADVPVNW